MSEQEKRWPVEAWEEGRRAGLEEAAKVADSYNQDPYPQTDYDRGWARGAECITKAIRALEKTSTLEGEE